MPVDEGVTVDVLVAVDVRGPRGPGLARLVEAGLGWQVVPADDPVLPARALLADVAGAARRPPGGPPLVLLVDDGDPPGVAARAARGAVAVLEPDPGPEELRAAVEGLAGRAVAPGPWRTVAASAGGVGATTVAAALAGLRAWTQGATLLVASGPVHVEGAPALAPADLAGPAAWAAAVPAAGVDDLRVARWSRVPDAVAVASLAPVATTVVDLGVGVAAELPVDVLVVRPDRAGQRAVETAAGRPAVVVVGTGPVPVAALGDAAGPAVALAWSARVAAAAAAGRLPAGLPGRWLRPLVPLVEGGAP